MRNTILALIVLMMFPVALFGAPAGNSAATQDHYRFGDLHVIELDWTADSGDGSFSDVQTDWAINGFLMLVETDPGSTAPTDNYDVYLKDGAGVDVMGGSAENRDTANSEITQPLINGNYSGLPVVGTLTLSISGNSVNSATGKVSIFYYSY